MPDQKKFLDAEGVKYLWSKINMQDYPNNETLMDVIEAIDETKADKSELIQSDWNQNDETALDYIKNRPFYDYEDYGEWLSFNVSTMEKSEYGDYYSMQVGRANPIGDFIFSLNVGDTIQVNWDGVIYNCQITLDDSAGCSFRQFGNLSIFNSVAENTGEPFGIMYGYNAWSTLEGYVHSYADMSNTTFLCRTYTINTRQLDEKHIPDTIARVKDIPEQVQSDWNQNDENSNDFIKNRPFGESEVTRNLPKSSNIAGKIYDIEFAKLLWDNVENAIYKASHSYINTSDGLMKYYKTYSFESIRNISNTQLTIRIINNDNNQDLSVEINILTGEISMWDQNGALVYYDGYITIPGGMILKLDEKYIPNNIPKLSTASIGQTIVVKSVDENGKPTEWEAVETQSDWNQNDKTAADYIKNKPEIATDDEIISMLMELDMLPAITDSDGSMLSDENGNILLW